MPIPSLQLQKKVEKACLMQRSRGFGHGVVVSKICYNAVIVLSVALWDCCKPWQTNEQVSRSTVDWKCGCQPFSCRCSQNVTQCQTRFGQHICLRLRHPFPPFLFGMCNLNFYRDKLEVPESSTLHQLCAMVASCPSLRCSCRKKPVSCREAEGLVTDLRSPRFVAIQWLCSQLCYVTAANQWTMVEIELLATVDWKWGCQPFSCPCSQNVSHCRKDICSTCLCKESIPFVKSKPSTPYQKLEVPESRSTFCQLCITLWLHHAHPSVAAAEKGRKSLSYAEKQRVWSRSCGLQDLLQCSDCALSCAMRLLQTMANQWTSVEINSGLEVGLPALQLPMFAKCDAVPNEIWSTYLFKRKTSIPDIPFWNV